MTIPGNPHAIVTIDRPGFADGQSSVRWDSWETQRLIERIDVELVTDSSSKATISVFDSNYRVIDAFSDPTSSTIVHVYLGYGPDLGQPVFKGILGEINRTAKGTRFTCFDMAFVMKLEKRAGYRNKKDDLAIIRDLVTGKDEQGKKKYNLAFDAPQNPKTLEHNAMMQAEQTDWEHMMERAQDAGLHIFVRHDTVFARYPNDFTSTPVMTIRPSEDKTVLEGWEFRYDTPIDRDAKAKVVVHRARGKGGKRIEGQSGVSTNAKGVQLVLKRDMANPSKSKLTKRAQAQKDLEREDTFKGDIETLFPVSGRRPDVLDTVRIEGIGKLLSAGGSDKPKNGYIVGGVNYHFAPGELTMALDLYRDVEI